MAALTPEEEQFLRDNILCVISTTKRDGSSQSTPVYYVFENGKLYISVTRPRAKTRNVLRDPRVSVVVLHAEPPFPHVQITGTAEITEDDLEPLTRRIFSLFMQSLLLSSAEGAGEAAHGGDAPMSQLNPEHTKISPRRSG